MEEARVFFGLIVGFGIGAVLFWSGWSAFRKRQMIENIPTSTVRGMAMGLVELCGSPRAEILLRAPFSQQDCVLYQIKVERYEQRGKSSHWVTMAVGDSFDNTFELVDSTGSVAVDPKGCELVSKPTYSLTTGFAQDLPPHLENYLFMRGVECRGMFGLHTLRFTEYNITTDETVYVLGTAGVAQGSAVRIARGVHEKTFIISDRSQKEVSSVFSWQTVLGIVLGSGMMVLFLWMLLTRLR